MSGVYGPADDAESVATIRRALDLGVNFLDTSASYGDGHNHRLIGEAIRGPRPTCRGAGPLQVLKTRGFVGDSRKAGPVRPVYNADQPITALKGTGIP
jgi:hypothetical protein